MAFDRNDPAQLAELKSEVETDPLGLGYIPNQTQAGVLDIINAKNPATTVAKPKVSSALIRSATTYDAYNNLAIDEQEWIRWMTGTNGFDEENMVVTADLITNLNGAGATSIWAVSNRTEMLAAMDAIFNVAGSRAEILWGYGTNITEQDWFAARDS